MYTALKIIRIPTGQTFTEYDRSGQLVRKEWFRVEWQPLGDGVPVKDMAEAKRVYGGSPVLEDAR
jgi:hypothetical protein